jgi:transcriptional regulator with XRE-family HTH domain
VTASFSKIGSDLAKRWIGHNLAILRESAGMTQQEAADELGRATQQHISQLESAQLLPKPELLQAMLERYGACHHIADFITMIAAARRNDRWWSALAAANTVPTWFAQYLGLEASAERLTIYSPLVIPDLLQTQAYAEAVARSDRNLTEDQVNHRVQLQLGRQHILDSTNPATHLIAILDESTLHRQRGNSRTMREQLTHLLDMSQHPHITLHILRYCAPAHPAERGGGFTLMALPAGIPPVVYLETLHCGTLDDCVEPYEQVLPQLRALATSQEDTRKLIVQLI